MTMKVKREIDPNHQRTQGALRTVGPVVLGLGLMFTAIGLMSFFQSFGSFEPPRYFWCMFVGMPLIAIGAGLTKLAYLGAIARYTLGEFAPVQKDTFNVLAEETRPGVESLAHALGRGFRAATGVDSGDVADQVQECPRCRAGNQSSARFCNQCGASLAPKTCPGCGRHQTADSQFCDQCGVRLS